MYNSFVCMKLINMFAYMFTVIEPPANVTATVLTSHSAEVTWDQSTSSDITGYLISYTTNALYASGGNVTVIGGNATSHTLNDLEENTPYNITVQTVRYGVISASSNEVSITTYTDSKWYTL